MSETANPTINPTLEVKIYGEVYHLRGDNHEEYLRELAQHVDRKMRELAERGAGVDPARLAILTALNVSDELFQCRRGQEGERVRLKEKVAELDQVLAEALL